ncbi:failed axon connections homolog isoform X3 [Palaemon carinicauda]
MKEIDVTPSPGSILTVMISILVTTFLVYIYRRIIVRQIRRSVWKSAGDDVVLVHCPTPGYLTPNISPFVMKLLTYLRLAQIPYKLEHDEPMGAKGKTPWITLNGEELHDSQLIIEALSKKFDKDFNSGLSEEEKAIARGFAMMIEEHIAWGLRVWRFIVDDGRTLLEGMKQPFFVSLIKPIFVRSQKAALWYQGLGRHSPSEVENMITADLRALSKYLGRKPYLMGDNLTEVDCTMFAFMANILYNYNRSPYYDIIKGEFTNLYDYVLRVKGRLWPDWNQCLEKTKLK